MAIDLIDELDPLDRRRMRIEELGRLTSGWLDGQGESVTANAVQGALVFLELRPRLANTFRIYPTPAGGILFEFKIEECDLSVELDPEGIPELYGIEIGGPGEIEPTSFGSSDDPAFLEVLDGYTGLVGA